MRNLKKILALVLALVMTMSVMSVASAATAGTSYSDDASITQYDEAIQVLTALGIYKGDEGGFRPNSTITRAEAAALVYRIISTDVTDKQTSIYAAQYVTPFTDVNDDDWFAGYVNFCANGQYIVGNGDGTFNCYGDITGYELLAIILRSLGYGKDGEYTGSGWEIKTATDARKLGITKNINESSLGKAQTRAAVAEMLFQGLTCTQTVDYSPLLGYTSSNSLISDTAYRGTLGYENFGLIGGIVDASTDDQDDAEAVDKSADEVADAVAKMTTRAKAEADEKYGEPVAYWYKNNTVNAANAIEVRFNPDYTNTVRVSEADLYTAAGGTRDSITAYNIAIDGDDDSNVALYKSRAAKGSALDNYAGKGTVTELYVVDGRVFVVIKNTYADTVENAYEQLVSGTVIALSLNNETDDIDYDDGAHDGDTTAQVAANKASLKGIAEDTLVLFNKYDNYVDFETIHTATSKTVTLTNSYVQDKLTTAENTEDSYILVNKTQYDYDVNCLNTAIYDAGDSTLLMDREELIATGDETQVIYFDDYGYIIYSEDVAGTPNTGYIVVTNVSYAGQDKDNGYVLSFKGYDLTGKSVSVKGAFDAYSYKNSLAAQDYDYTIGIYSYTVDSETGLYNVDSTSLIADEQPDAVMAGDPDSVTNDAVIADDTTVFIVAEYSKKGAITGYSVKTGIKNIADLTDAGMQEGDANLNYDSQVEWAVSYVDAKDDGVIDTVLVMGAKQTADTKYTSSVMKSQTDVFYLVDVEPEKQFSEYDLFTVIMDGKLTTLKVAKDSNAETDLNSLGAEGFYEIAAYTNDYVSEVEAVDAGEFTYEGISVLGFDGDYWDYASCHEGEGDGDYVVLADNAKIYDLTNTKNITTVNFSDLKPDSEGNNKLGYSTVEGIVAEYNNYGFATVLYILGE
jgi:hypothetical protein